MDCPFFEPGADLAAVAGEARSWLEIAHAVEDYRNATAGKSCPGPRLATMLSAAERAMNLLRIHGHGDGPIDTQHERHPECRSCSIIAAWESAKEDSARPMTFFVRPEEPPECECGVGADECTCARSDWYRAHPATFDGRGTPFQRLRSQVSTGSVGTEILIAKIELASPCERCRQTLESGVTGLAEKLCSLAKEHGH